MKFNNLLGTKLGIILEFSKYFCTFAPKVPFYDKQLTP